MEKPSFSTATTIGNSDSISPVQTFNIGRKTVYAWALNGLPAGPISFDLTNPAGATSITSSATTPFAGTWINNQWYIITYTTNQLKTVDTTTGAETLVGNTGVTSSYTVTGMAYDDVTATLYGTWAYAVGATLYTAVYSINIATGLATHIGTDISTDALIDIACDSLGNFYGVGLVTDSLYSLDPTVPSMTVIGSLGILLNYAQGAGMDKDTDTLYLAAYTGSGGLYTCNTATGQATLVGNFPSGSEVDCLAIPYSGTTNNPPAIPNAPSGPSTGVVGTSYSFTASTTDPDGDNISYMFDWGDGTDSGWLGPFVSGATATGSHAWTAVGAYNVKVKAKDIHDSESGWSAVHAITISPAGPTLEIANITGGLFKVKTSIKNTGTETITNINWSIKLDGGIILLGKETTGTITGINAGGSVAISSKMILGFGATTITVTASSISKTQDAKVLLIFVKIL